MSLPGARYTMDNDQVALLASIERWLLSHPGVHEPATVLEALTITASNPRISIIIGNSECVTESDRGMWTHVWVRYMAELLIAAKNVVHVPTWAEQNRVPRTPTFIAHVFAVAAEQGMHVFSGNHVRLQSTLNITSASELRAAVIQAGRRGLDRVLLIQEYASAFIDLNGMVDNGTLYTAHRRVWHMACTKHDVYFKGVLE